MKEYNSNNPRIFLYIYFLDASFPIFNSYYKIFLRAVINIDQAITNIIMEGLEPGTAEKHHG